uniref:LTA synthase family protein n=1 Tax=Bifidobacterium aesculapii TaxID=1329411 RepID=UPI000ADA06A7
TARSAILPIRRTAAKLAATAVALAPAQAANTTAHAIIRTVINTITRAAAVLRVAWRKRPKLPYTLYVLVMALMTAAATIFIQWGMYSEPTYDDPDAVDQTTKIMNSVNGQLTRFISQMWLEESQLNWLLNFLALGMVYLVLVFVLNRFWVATAIFGIVMSVYAVANAIKVELRNEPILPSDLSFLTSGNGGEITSFIPDDRVALVHGTVSMLIWLTAICLALQLADGRRCVIPFHWKHPFRNWKTIAGNVTRLVAAGTSVALLCSFTFTLSVPSAWGYEWAKSWGDSPQLWNAMGDAQSNGPTVNFLRLTHPKIMEKPDGYSRETMEALARKYTKTARATNATRASELTDSTVIMILSETFSDPTRVPGITLTEDPMPNIRALKDTTTSGLMLSPGYGGGTANIEYQTLTGLDLALFDDSMQSMYQELVPHQKNPFAWNRIWNAKYGKGASTAFHPYYKNMYLRDANYKKFGFSRFYTLDSTPAITHQDRIDNSPYVSDAASYQNVLDQLNAQEHPQFLQLVTMQNHMTYDGWYNDNQFDAANISDNLNDYERGQINTYMKGVSITDQTTIDFLNQLNALDKPVTVVFYGDHLPSAYQTAAEDEHNTLTLHETDYFIWSNQASGAAGAGGSGVKLDPAASKTAVTSPNYFMSLAAEHMNAKVTPYLAFLDAARGDIPAMERLVLGAGGFADDTSTTYLDAEGNAMKRRNLSKQAKRTLRDYRLIQYDMTAGKGYLAETGFFDAQ